MTKGISWLLVAFVLLVSAGCAAETPPELPAAEPEEPATTVDEATAEPTAAELATAESEVTATETTGTGENMTETEPAATERPYASPTPHPEEAATLELNPIQPGPEQKQQITYAKNELAARLGVDVDGIEVTAYETVTWSDGSLGCPQPGMMYTQALVDGYLIQLRVDGQTYNYHGANGRDPFLCVKDGDESTAVPQGGFPATPPPSSEDI